MIKELRETVRVLGGTSTQYDDTERALMANILNALGGTATQYDDEESLLHKINACIPNKTTDANLKPENIKQGITILGVTGTATNVITAPSVDKLPADAPEGTIAIIEGK